MLDSFILKKVNSVEIVFYFLNKLVNVTNEKKLLLLSVKEPLTCQAYQNCKIFPQELLNYIWSFVFEIIFRKDSINEFFSGSLWQVGLLVKITYFDFQFWYSSVVKRGARH